MSDQPKPTAGEWTYEAWFPITVKEIQQLREQVATATLRLAVAQAAIVKCKDALQSLRDFQNGCPLPSYEKHWTEAMELTDECLAMESDTTALDAAIAEAKAQAEVAGWHKGFDDCNKANEENKTHLIAETTAAAQQPLVDALESLEFDQFGIPSSWPTSGTVAAALAKVTERK